MYLTRTLIPAILLCGIAGCSQTSRQAEMLQPTIDRISRMTGESDADVETGISVARVQEQQGQLREARERLEAIAVHAPNHKLVPRRLAVVTSKLGDYEAANQYFEAALKTDPHNAELLADYGYSLMLQNDMTAAEEQLRVALQEAPGDKRVLNNLALVIGHNGNFDESFELFRKVGGEASAWTSLGYVHVQRGDGPKATDCFSRALTVDDRFEPAAQALVQIAERKKQPRGTPAPEAVVHADFVTATPALASRQASVATAAAEFDADDPAEVVPAFVRELQFESK